MGDDKDAPKTYGAVCLRKQRRKRQKLLLIELFLDYAKNSTLHGLRYITERGLTILEKLFWFFTFTCSVVICVLLIRNVYIKWKTSPVIVSFSEHIVPVGKVPFPSVTICPQIKCMANVYNFEKKYQDLLDTKDADVVNNELYTIDAEGNKNMSSFLNMTDEIEKVEDLSLVCDSQGYLETFLSRGKSNSSVIDHIREVSPDLQKVLLSCLWRDKERPCQELFSPVLTREGICYNFNSLAAHEIFRTDKIQSDYSYLGSNTSSKDWNLTGGYVNAKPDTYPRRGRENGANPDLEVILMEDIDARDGLCNSLNKGYKIYVQHPADMPQSSLYYYAALPKQVSSLALKFNMLTTSDSLKEYLPDVRQCYFPEDRPLKYFAIYTQNNCRLECQSNYTFQKCGCVWFNMPHHDSRSVCTIDARGCVNTAQDRLAYEEMKADNDYKSGACGCFPDCYSVYYDAEILKTEFDFESYIKTYNKVHDYGSTENEGNYSYSKIEMYFKEPRFVSMRRSELFGITDFVANCGGLLGLFLGFSFLSLVEIIYFATLRVYYTLKRDLKAEKRNSLSMSMKKEDSVDNTSEKFS